MHTISVQIVRFTDSHQPGWVECVLRDAASREWTFIEKVPIVTNALLDAASVYPQRGVVACEIVEHWTDEHGRIRCIIDTERPWGIEAKNGETQFEVFIDQITTTANQRTRTHP
jgi:hypothetical protein